MIGNPFPNGHAFDIQKATDDDLKAIVAFAANPLPWIDRATHSTGMIEVDGSLLVAAIGELTRRGVLA